MQFNHNATLCVLFYRNCTLPCLMSLAAGLITCLSNIKQKSVRLLGFPLLKQFDFLCALFHVSTAFKCSKPPRFPLAFGGEVPCLRFQALSTAPTLRGAAVTNHGLANKAEVGPILWNFQMRDVRFISVFSILERTIALKINKRFSWMPLESRAACLWHCLSLIWFGFVYLMGNGKILEQTAWYFRRI